MTEALLKTAPLSTRPLLSRDEAAAYTREHYFARGGWLTEPDGPWHPAPVTSPPQGRVLQVDARKGPYRTVQQAVNAAVASGPRNARVWIAIAPGVYRGVVYLPAGAPPVTLYGTGETPQDCALSLRWMRALRRSSIRRRSMRTASFSPATLRGIATSASPRRARRTLALAPPRL